MNFLIVKKFLFLFDFLTNTIWPSSSRYAFIDLLFNIIVIISFFVFMLIYYQISSFYDDFYGIKQKFTLDLRVLR